MPIARRSFLRIAGSSAVILAAGTGAFVSTRTPAKALAPWGAAGTGYADPRMRALSYAILAPNPHNRQPWLVDLSAPGEIVLTCDLERLLPETDPFGRQIVIGLGCFLELLKMAAGQQGYRAEIEAFPDGVPGQALDERPVARIRFHKSGQPLEDPLFTHVLDRRSNKAPFDTEKPLAETTLEALRGAAAGAAPVRTTLDPARVAELRALTWQAHLLEMNTPRTLMESVRLMRIGKREIEALPDGIDLGGGFLEGLSLLGLMTRETLADPGSRAFAQGIEMFRDILGTAMGYIWLTSDGNSRLDQLDSGRDWLRLNLKATELGLGFHPISQALQEYPEMAELHDRLRRQLGTGKTQTVQMLGRLGYGPTVPASPRWPLETRVRQS